MIKKLILGAIGAGIVVAGYFGFYLPSRDINVGVDLPEAPALFETSLAAPISSTATTIPLSSIIVRGGEELANYNCFTIDEGSSQAEFVCGTISTSTTSLINAARGVSAKDGFTENAALQFSHRRGASVKVTDFPIIQLLRSQNNGDEAFENVLKYASGVVPSGANELADVGYVLSVVTGGTVSFDGLTVGATAGETVSAGQVVYFKTSDQQWYLVDSDTSATYTGVLLGMAQGAGVDDGAISGGVLLNGVDANLTGLTAGSEYYISSIAGQATTTVGTVSLGVAKSTTELIFDRLFNTPSFTGNNTFSGNNTFTGTNSFSATTTFTGPTVGFGTASVTVFTTTGTSTFTKNANTKFVTIEVQGAGGGGYGADFDDTVGLGGSGSAGGYCKKTILATSLSSTETVTVGAAGTGGTSASTPTSGTAGGSSSFGSHCTANGGSAGNIKPVIVSGGTATGGDINITGGSSYGNNLQNASGFSQGGDSQLGKGGSSIANTGASATAYKAPVGYGSGGYGGVEYGSGFVTGGGAGAPGIVIVTEYY